MTGSASNDAHLGRSADAIRRAFAGVPYPGDTNIARRSPLVPWELDPEPQQIEAFFAGKTWQQVTAEALRTEYRGDESACLIFMTPAAFRYYLPAYMLVALQGFEVADMIIPSTLSLLTPHSLVPGPDVYGEDDFETRVEPLTVAERAAVAQFLLAMQTEYGAIMLPSSSPIVPLHLFWSQYLPEADRVLLPRFPREEVEASRQELVEIMRKHGAIGA